MSFSAADDLKERVREATDIVALIGSHLQLEPRGSQLVALCPFHDDTNPSLRVNPDRQSWKCWACDAGGDVFSFVMRRENVDFPGALRILAEQAGIEWKSHGPKAAPGSPNDKATLYKAMAWAELQFHRYLLEGSEAAAAREYLQQRHINADSIKLYRIGYAPNEWQWLSNRARSTSWSPAVLEALGLVIRKENGRTYDRFRGRVMFPIRDTQDRPIAVGGRILPQFKDDSSAKYINSPETRLYTKSDQLYGLHLCREVLEQQRKQNQIRNVIVMEGYTDVVVSRQEGIATPVAVCGTALTEKHIALLRRFCDRVTLVLDGDEAGQKRASQVLELFLAGQIEVRMVRLPDGLDPCDYVLQRGPDALRQLIEDSPDALDYCVERETAGINLNVDTQRAATALERILETMAHAPRLKEDTEASFRLREQQTLGRLARMFRVDEPLVRQQLMNYRAKSKVRAEQFSPVDEPAEVSHLTGWDRDLFILLLQNPHAVTAIVEKVALEDVQSETARTLLTVYQDLEASGELPDYQRVMDATEDPRLKNILAELVEAADRTQPDDPELQLSELLAAYALRREKGQRRQQIATLQSGKLEEQEEIDLLVRLIESKRLDS